jgi:hypothetical protein
MSTIVDMLKRTQTRLEPQSGFCVISASYIDGLGLSSTFENTHVPNIEQYKWAVPRFARPAHLVFISVSCIQYTTFPGDCQVVPPI